MATSLTSRLLVSLAANFSSTLDLVTSGSPLHFSDVTDLANGTGADQADLIFSDERTLAASASEDLDLAGVLTDAFGNTITNARVKLLLIKADADNTNNVLVGGAAATQFVNWVSDSSDVVVVRPGGLFLLVAPDATAYAVGAGASDLLKIANSAAGTSVTYQIVVLGASA